MLATIFSLFLCFFLSLSTSLSFSPDNILSLSLVTWKERWTHIEKERGQFENQYTDHQKRKKEKRKEEIGEKIRKREVEKRRNIWLQRSRKEKWNNRLTSFFPLELFHFFLASFSLHLFLFFAHFLSHSFFFFFPQKERSRNWRRKFLRVIQVWSGTFTRRIREVKNSCY